MCNYGDSLVIMSVIIFLGTQNYIIAVIRQEISLELENLISLGLFQG